MDSQSSSEVGFDSEFENLLNVKGGFLKRFRYRKLVAEAKTFYKAYVKKCNEYNDYIDFFEPLLGYLILCGFGYDKSVEYLSEIRNGIIAHLEKSVPSNMIKELKSLGKGS